MQTSFSVRLLLAGREREAGCQRRQAALAHLAATRYMDSSGHSYAAAAAATLRTAKESITLETPLMIMLTPTSVPIAHAELAGHCI